MRKHFKRSILLPGLSSWSVKVIDGFLANHHEELRCEFALRWFKNNEKNLEEMGITVPPNVSNNWKVSMVLGHKLSGGLGAEGDIKKSDYKDIRDKLNKIKSLRADIKEENMSIEVPFLLINYLKGKPKTGLVVNELINKVAKENLFLKAQKLIEADNAQAKWVVRNIKSLPQENLAHNWSDEHEKRINDKINEFVGDLAGSFDVSTMNIKNFYRQAKEDTVSEITKDFIKFASFSLNQRKKLLRSKEFKKIALLNKEEQTAIDKLKSHWQILIG